jgi:hypothetical protein
VPSIVGRNRLDHKAITPISFARAPALVLFVIAVLSGTPRGIELCECRCIFPEFVWRLQWLPCDDIAGVVQLQANYLKHEAVLSLPPEMTRLADLQHLACSRKFASLTALRSRSWFETARTAWSLDLRVEELLRARGAHIGFGDEGGTGIDSGRHLLALRRGERRLDAVITHAERVLHDEPGDRVTLE